MLFLFNFYTSFSHSPSKFDCFEFRLKIQHSCATFFPPSPKKFSRKPVSRRRNFARNLSRSLIRVSFSFHGGTTRRPVAKPQFRLSGRDTPRKKGGGGRRKANGIRLKAASTVTASRDCVGGKFFENIFRKRRVYEKTEDQARNFIIISGSSCEIHEIFDTLFFLPSSSSLRHIRGCIDSIGEPDAARDFFRVGGSLA